MRGPIDIRLLVSCLFAPALWCIKDAHLVPESAVPLEHTNQSCSILFCLTQLLKIAPLWILTRRMSEPTGF